MSKTKNIEQTLAERKTTHGDFSVGACGSQMIKAAMRDSPNWDELPDYMKESLEMIASKISRILSGNYNHVDSWHDISGYASLVEKMLE